MMKCLRDYWGLEAQLRGFRVVVVTLYPASQKMFRLYRAQLAELKLKKRVTSSL